jgi:hypothetical protein
MPAGEAMARLDRAEAAGLRIAAVDDARARAALRAGRRDDVRALVRRIETRDPEAWLRRILGLPLPAGKEGVF